MRCRFCSAPLEHIFADLGLSPLANSYVPADRAAGPETFLPLRALVCSSCYLVQLDEHPGTPEVLFSDYAYFSSYSTTWLEHMRAYVEQMSERFGIGPSSTVVEVASNDGYLLKYFKEAGARVLGIEPAANVAAVAEAGGVPTVVRFFGRETAAELRPEHEADLLIGNNVLAHVPDINDFVGGLQFILAPNGVLTMEFPHLLRLVEEIQFDTIYHEHFSYLSLSTVDRVFSAHGLQLFDVEEVSTHGGSLRVFARHDANDDLAVGHRVTALLERERDAGYGDIDLYVGFAERVKASKRAILSFFVDAKERGLTIAGYGAPAKGNTLLNYCGIGTDFIDYTVDRNPHKQGHLLPGSRIPIRAPEEIDRTKPDYLFILPWNLRDEIIEQMHGIRAWGGKFVARTPELTVIS